ncbi:MAG: DUF2017 family protein [Actinobacteria bacterium]|nr:MAG: DUF2017 family protein [Actinomycetota bacterium]
MRIERWIERNRKGEVVVDIDDSIRDAMRTLLDELRELLMTGDHPGLRRLYPTAYPQDEDLEEGYRSLVHDSLLAQRLDSIEAMENSLDAKLLTDKQLDAWMHGVNSVRLVLGTILDVGEGDELPDADAPDAQQRVLYYILGYLLEQIVDVLFSTVPVDGFEDDPL